MKIPTLTIVGVGLIGGSIGLAARQRGLAGRILGVGRSSQSLDIARRRGAIDEGFLDLSHALPQADVVVFCTPVDRIAEQVLAASTLCRPGTLLIDTGSTKGGIVHTVDKNLAAPVGFVGCHPLAGLEKSGPEFADPILFDNRLTVVTPTPRTDPDALEKVQTFWKALGSRIRLMSPEEHDQALALCSHLPHLLAAALAGILPAEIRDLAATGFRDTTRIAAGDPELWTAICSQNRTAVRDALELFLGRLREFQYALEQGNDASLRALLTQAKKGRDALGN